MVGENSLIIQIFYLKYFVKYQNKGNYLSGENFITSFHCKSNTHCCPTLAKGSKWHTI